MPARQKLWEAPQPISFFADRGSPIQAGDLTFEQIDQTAPKPTDVIYGVKMSNPRFYSKRGMPFPLMRMRRFLASVGLISALLITPTSLQGTDVSGTIAANATWKLAASPYNLTGYTRLNQGATLTVEPGVIVNGNGNYLEVFGIFNVAGSSSSKVSLTNLFLKPGTNSLSQPFSIIIRYAHLVGGSVYSATGNAVYGSLTMEDCYVESPSNYYYLWYPAADCLIRRNIFVGVVPGYALFSVGSNGDEKIIFRENTFCQSGVAIENWASAGTSMTIATGNNFIFTNFPTLVLRASAWGSSAKIVATNNYWGTTDTDTINQMIFDKNDNADSGDYIAYVPFLAAPNPDAAPLGQPLIQVQPEEQTATAGTEVSFSVQARGIGLTYQWQFEGTNLSSKTNATLILPSVSPAQAGNYKVAITDAASQSVTSSPAALTVKCLLTIEASQGGYSVSSPEFPDYAAGSVVTLTAKPDVGYGFIRWSGDASGSANPLALTMTTNKTVSAVFASTALTLATQGRGTISKTPDQGFYAIGDHVTLTCMPDRWHGLSSWADGPTTNPRVITIGEHNAYTAIFSPTTALENITIGNISRLAPVGMPAVTVDGELIITSFASARRSATITLSTTFPGGWLFYTTDGADPALSGSLYAGPLAVSADCTLRTIAYTSDFTQSVPGDPVDIRILPVLIAITTGGGTVSIIPPSGAYLSNAKAVVTASPYTGWTFLHWLGDATGTNPTANITMTRDKKVQAVFGTPVNTTTAGAGSILRTASSSFYPFGYQLRLTAVPGDGNYLLFWANAASGTNNPLTFTVTNPTPTITAVFSSIGSADTNTLTVIATGSGHATLTPPGNRFPRNSRVLLTAVPDPGQAFTGWSGAASGTQNPLDVAVTSNMVIFASFTRQTSLALDATFPRQEGVRLTLTGEVGTDYRILTSTNLLDWTPAADIQNTYGISEWTDTAATNVSVRFYRSAN